MYVEINRRQSGKTERLINAMYVWLSENNFNIAYVVTKNSYMGESIIQRYKKKYNCICRIKKIHSGDRMQETAAHVKYFVDEFDFIDEKRLEIFDNAYYCTTAKKQRNFTLPEYNKDFFICLVEAANKSEDCLYAPKFPEFADHLPYKERLTQCYNEFMLHNEHKHSNGGGTLKDNIIQRLDYLERMVANIESNQYANQFRNNKQGKI